MSYMRPISHYIKKHPKKVKKWNTNDFYDRRAQDGSNTHMLAKEGSPPGSWPFQVFVRCYNDINNNTATNRETWGRELAEHLTVIGMNIDPNPNNANKYSYQHPFEYICDVSDDPLPPANKFLLDHDLKTLIKQQFSTIPLDEISSNEKTMATYFGTDPTNIAKGRSLLLDLIESSDVTSDVSSVASNE